MRRWVHVDPNTREYTFGATQDVEPILERNKELRSQPQKSDWKRRIGIIPNVILTRWLNEEWERGNISLKFLSAEYDALIKRKLNDPDWSWLRTDK